MYYTGPMIAAFIVYHLLHLTLGTVHPDFSEHDVYANVVYRFQQWPVSLAYTVAIGLLCLHLYHGIYSMFQSLGLTHPALHAAHQGRRPRRRVSLLHRLRLHPGRRPDRHRTIIATWN